MISDGVISMIKVFQKTRMGRRCNLAQKRAFAVQQRLTAAQWSLGMVLVWITYRSEEAAINLTSAAIRDLLSALRSGKLGAHGMVKLRSLTISASPPRHASLIPWRAFFIAPAM